jgi:spermidine/putrescine transport system substrate-binding protein
MIRRQVLKATALASAFFLGLAGGLAGPVQAAETINALVWCDHDDAALIDPFTAATGIGVNRKVYEGTGQALSIIEQSQPGDWDVIVVDGIDIPRLVEKNLLDPLPEDQLPFADMFSELRMDAQTVKDGKRYAIMEKFGYNSISFNKEKVDAADMQTTAILWSDKYKGRIAIYDYYLPVIGLVAMGLGKKTAELTEADMPAIRDALFKMKGVAKLVGDVATSQNAIATGEVDILVGGGEWVTAGLARDNPALDFTLPREGGVLWSQSLGIFADSSRKEAALKFVQYIMSPEGQARLATSSCYWAMPTNAKAALGDEEKRILRWNDQQEFLKSSQLYPAPSAELDARMQEIWTEMLQQ